MANDIGKSLKGALETVGIAFSILNSGEADVDGGYLTAKTNRQVTKPFIREFFRDAEVAYDTDVVSGDVIKFDVTDEVFVVINSTPQVVLNEIIRHLCVLYKCNVSGEIQRPSGEAEWDDDYRKGGDFEIVRRDCYALQTEALFGHDLETDEELGRIGLQEHELYIPHSNGMQVLDRYEPFSGEYYQVETIKKRRLNQVNVVNLSENTR